MRTSKEEMSWQEKRNADGEGEVSRDRSGLVWAYGCSTATVTTVLSPLPPIVIPGIRGRRQSN